MALYGMFAPSVLGMTSQTRAMNTIGINIANVNTGGYKEIDTNFKSVFSDTINTTSDFGGVLPTEYNRISKQGFLQASNSNLDLAINGRGFFLLNSNSAGSGTELYGRDGALALDSGDEITLTDANGTEFTSNEGYLIDKNGYFLMGWPYDFSTGTVDTSGSPSGVRVDQFAFTDNFLATSTGELQLNIPATADLNPDHSGAVTLANAGNAPDGFFSYTAQIVDSAGTAQDLQLNFTKQATNTWQMSVTTNNASDTLSPPQTTPITLTFNPDGSIATPDPATQTITATFAGTTATTGTMALDISRITQFNGDFVPFSYEANGFARSDLRSFAFDSDGNVVGRFADTTVRNLYKLPLVGFTNPDGLEPINGNVYKQSPDSGSPTLLEAGQSGIGSFVPNTLELSNVDLADQFTRMILTQTAYNASSTAFKTNDEMLKSVGDLKR
ncbi:MAG: flagellar hook protein FlgE [Magnetovibrionaceae bacterium]